MTVNKQELINFVEGFNGSSITKQDVLDFIANANQTRVNIEYADFQVNDGVKKYWGDEDDLIELLDDVDFAKKVIVDFDDDEDSKITREDVLTVIEFFVNEGYKVIYADINCVKFEKD